ncbi:MAG: SRPBCC family protein [Terriglobales bacterium]
MATRRYWKGFVTGTAVGAGAVLGTGLLARIFTRSAYVQRFEKTVQIGKPVEEVFKAWTDLTRLPQMSSMLRELRTFGERSYWKARVDGKDIEWEAQIEQFIPNQAIGWKSIRGPKHTGRVSFSPLGNDTVLHVTMNYAPRPVLLRPFVRPMGRRLEAYIEQALRDFKASLEGKGQERVIRTGPVQAEPAQATGTYSGTAVNPMETKNTRFGGPPSPIEYTRPPEAKS